MLSRNILYQQQSNNEVTNTQLMHNTYNIYIGKHWQIKVNSHKYLQHKGIAKERKVNKRKNKTTKYIGACCTYTNLRKRNTYPGHPALTRAPLCAGNISARPRTIKQQMKSFRKGGRIQSKWWSFLEIWTIRHFPKQWLSHEKRSER